MEPENANVLAGVATNQATHPGNHPISVISMTPIEIYQRIFQFVGVKGLAVLSQVSRTFQSEAEFIIYDFVDLSTPERSRAHIRSWCNAVTSVERRAHRVRTLRFPALLPNNSASQIHLLDGFREDAELQGMVEQAFSVIINLKHLFLLGPFEILGRPVSIRPSTLINCTFNLSSFAGQASKSTTQEQIDFLLKHKDLEYWVPTQPFLQSIEALPPNMLLHLREMVLVRPSLTKALTTRPLEALVLVFIEATHSRAIGINTITPMSHLRNTLHTLEYTHGLLSSDWSTTDIINTLARETPNLNILTFTSLGDKDSVTPADRQQGLVDAVAKLHRLKTLALNTHMDVLLAPINESPDPLNPLELSPTWENRSPAQFRKTASQFIVACPSLQQLSFPDSTGSISLAYVRLGETARFDGFYKFDNLTWWMR